MINKSAKGCRTEKRCADELIAQGYTQDKIKLRKKRQKKWVMEAISLIWKVVRTRYQSLDLFGLFDVMALHPEGDHILFIQTKSNQCDNKTRDAIRALKMPPSCRKEIWIWKDQRGWVKEYYE